MVGFPSRCYEALALFKIYNPSFETVQLVEGFPARRADGRLFVKEDYQQVVRETRVKASIIAEDINMERFEPDYDEQGQKCPMSTPGPVYLRSDCFWMSLASPSTPSTKPAPKSGVERSSLVRDSALGSIRKV